jgi:cell division septum initiation protein DivIVA
MITKIREAIQEEKEHKKRLEELMSRLARRTRSHHMPVAATASATAPVHDGHARFVREPEKERAAPLSAPFPVFGKKKKIIGGKQKQREVYYDPKKGVTSRYINE